MLDRAYTRISEVSAHEVIILQGDLREIDLPFNHYDILLAGAVLHHLRDDSDWENVFTKLFHLLKPGGCLMISDLITQETEVLNDFIWEKYGDYLEKVGGAEYRYKVLNYIDKEDSPRSLNYQLDLMKKTGFKSVEILHKNICFAAYGGIK
jgi:tRNA (cmo5U34)-methyltransferase